MFDWKLHFKWFDDGNDLVPCMSGGLFGITCLGNPLASRLPYEGNMGIFVVYFWGGLRFRVQDLDPKSPIPLNEGIDLKKIYRSLGSSL